MKTNTELKHYLSNDENWDVTFETYQPAEMLEAIKKHLSENKSDTVVHRKEYPARLKKKYAGDETINFYENNPKTGEPSKVIIKGNRTFYQKLS